MTKYNRICTLNIYAFDQCQVSIIGKCKFSSIYKSTDNIIINKIGRYGWSIIQVKKRMSVTYKISIVGTINI